MKPEELGIEKYTINKDGSIDVHQSVYIIGDYTKIPIKFNIVNGNFDCSDNNLKTLENAPNEVYGNVILNGNQLTNLIGCPSIITGDLYVLMNDLRSLEGAPEKCEDFVISNNVNLKSLKYSPTIVNDYYCVNCNIENLYGISKDINDLFIDFNNLYTLIGLDQSWIRGKIHCMFYNPIYEIIKQFDEISLVHIDSIISNIHLIKGDYYVDVNEINNQFNVNIKLEKYKNLNLIYNP